MIEVGRKCVKLAGRDANQTCVIVEVVDQTTVIIDGGVRRRKCNINHLYLLPEVLDVKKGSHEEVKAAFEAINLPVWDKKKKEASEKPTKQRAVKEKKPAKKKAVKKEAPKAKETTEAKEEKKAPAKKAVKKTVEKKE